MSHPRSYVWPSVVIGLLIALVVIQGTKLYHASKVEPCQCKPVASCSCPEVTPCTCDHAALLDLHKECKASIEELRGHVEAIEDRLSKGESRILSEWLKGKDELKAIQRRLDKLEGRKPPVRRQASCGAHPPTCEGIAALGADGERDSVTRISLIACSRLFDGERVINPSRSSESDVIARVGIGPLEQAAKPFCPLLELPSSVHGESPLAGDSTVARVTPATGIVRLCATADESTLKPCQPLRNAFRVWQTWEIEQGKRAEKRRKAWAALKLFIALQDGQAT